MTRPKVLFVDDEKRVLNSMRALFRRDYELHLTTDGAEAVRIAQEQGIDVIIADQRMPGMSGVDVLGEIRRRVPSAVRILLTGYADLDAVEGSINIGEVFRFLSKPCPPQELRETLAEAVQVARQSGVSVQAPARDEMPEPVGPVKAVLPECVPAAPLESEPSGPEPSVPQTSESETRGSETPAFEPSAAAISAKETDQEHGFDDHSMTVPNLAVELEFEQIARERDSLTETWASDEGTTETEIIMSGESTVEFVDTIVIGDESVDRRSNRARDDMDNVGVALFTSDGGFAEEVERVIGERYRLTRASTLVQVTDLLSDSGAGVLLTDFCSDGSMLRNMISTLKRYLPELITIVISDERDAAEMISLINHGQVFRYMSKPMDEGRLVQNVNAAVLRHIQLRENPELARRHSVVPDRPPREATALLAQFVGRLREMRRFWVRT